MRIKTKSFQIFLIIALVLSFLPFPALKTGRVEAQGLPPKDVTAELKFLPDQAGVYEYYTGSSYGLKLQAQASGKDNPIYNPTLVISYPNDYVSIRPSELPIANPKIAEVVKSGTTTTITYKFDLISGGSGFTLPMTVSTNNGMTPDQYKLKVTAKIIDSQGQTRAETMIETTHKTRKPTITKYMNNIEWRTVNGGTVYGGAASAPGSGIITSNVKDAATVVFSYMVNIDGADGNRVFAPLVIEDTLPTGAFFDPAANPNWTLSVDGTKVIYTYPEAPSHLLNNGFPIVLKLKFPGFDTQGGNAILTNEVRFKAVPKNPSEYEKTQVYEGSSKLVFSLNSYLPMGSFSKSKDDYKGILDTLSYKTKIARGWNIGYTNRSFDRAVENLVFEDFDLDPRLKYVQVSLLARNLRAYTGTMSIFGVTSADVEEIIAEKLDTSIDNVINLTPDQSDRFVKLRYKFDQGGLQAPNSSIYVNLATKIKNPAAVNFDMAVPANNFFPNSAAMSANYVGGTAQEIKAGPATDKMELVQRQAAAVHVGKWTNIRPNTPVFVNDRIDFTIDVATQAPPDPDEGIQGRYLVDLLPIGTEYIPNSTKRGFSPYDSKYSTGLFEPEDILVSVEPQVIPDYRQTGRTALVWEYKKAISGGEVGDRFVTYQVMTYSAIVTVAAEDGTQTNQIYYSYDNNGPNGITTHRPMADSMDIDGDGNKTEIVSYYPAPYVYKAPLVVISRKYAKGNLNSIFIPTGAVQELGMKGDFKLEVFNNTEFDVNTLSLLDVLPHVGDFAITQNVDKVYLPRNSQYRPLMTGPIEAVDGYDIYYNTELPNADLATGREQEYYSRNSWVTGVNIKDWNAVKGIKIIMQANKKLAPGERVNFIIPMEAPMDFSLADGTAAINSFAISTDTGTTFIEAIKSQIEIIKYKVSGTLFKDSNRDSTLNTGEKLYPNKKIWLEDMNGNPVTNPDGSRIETVTDANGHYSLEVAVNGKYRVAFDSIADMDMSVTQPGELFERDKSHLAVDSLKSDVFTLNKDNRHEIRNAGLYPNFSELFILKSVNTALNEPIADANRLFNFTVLVNGQPYNGRVDFDNIEDAKGVVNGKLSFSSKQKVTLYPFNAGDVVTVTEVANPFYGIAETSKNFTFRGKDSNTMVFKNTELALGELTVAKIVNPADAISALKEKLFDFTVTGPNGYSQQFQLKSGESKVLTGLVYGEYTVAEAASNEFDTTFIPAASATVTIDSPKARVEAVNGYKVPRGNVTVKKVWEDTDAQHPDVTLHLLADGTEVAVTTLSGNLEHEFTDLPLTAANGKPIVYTVTEDPVEGYEAIYDGLTVKNRKVGKLSIEKKLYDFNGVEIAAGREFNYLLQLNGTAYNGKAKLNGQETTIRNGRISFANGSIVLIEGIAGEPTYEVTEAQDAVHQAKQERFAGKISGGTETKLLFENTEKAVGELSVSKVVNPANAIDELKNKVFDFTVKGPNGYEQKFQLKSGDRKVLSGLVFGEYEVLEAEAENFKTSYTPSNKVTLSYNSRTGAVEAVNGYEIPLQDVAVKKIWVGNDSPKKPEITLHLLADGTRVATVKLKDMTEHVFTGLAKTKADGSPIVYTVLEERVENYQAKYDGLTVTNHYVNPEVSISNPVWGPEIILNPKPTTVSTLPDQSKTDSATIKLPRTGEVGSETKIGFSLAFVAMLLAVVLILRKRQA